MMALPPTSAAVGAAPVTKTIYFTVSGHNEQAEFSSDDTVEDVKELFRVAAEANENDILKLYNVHGSLVNISGRLPSNSPKTRYRLEVVAIQSSETVISSSLGIDVAGFQKRLEDLDRKASLQVCEIPEVVYNMKCRVECLREKFANLEYLSWLGLYKDLSIAPTLQPFWNKKKPIPKTPEMTEQVFRKFDNLIQAQVTKDTREYLKKPSFDNWQWDDAEMLHLLRQMFIDLSLVTEFKMEMNVLNEWLRQIYKHYNNVPFHNFKHCFMVTQMMYGLIYLTDLPKKLDGIEILILIISAICHDLDHPGYNNAYQVNARTELALRYNDISPLENHHCSVAFKILENQDCNICRNMEPEMFKRLREGMIKCILATDMAKHNEILKTFKSITPMFDFGMKDHKDLLMQIIVKVGDVSNEIRPIYISEPWLDCLLREFFNQLHLLLMKCADLSNEVRPIEVSERWLNCLLTEFFIQLMMILIKTSDISNEVRPMDVAKVWVERLFEEYFNQTKQIQVLLHTNSLMPGFRTSDMEKLEGLPVTPFMDREKVTKPSSQIGFIKFVLLPLFEALVELFPVIHNDIIRPAQHALDYYMEMQQALDTEKNRKEEEEREAAAAMVQLADDDADIKGMREKHKTKIVNNLISKDTKSKGDSLLTVKDLDNNI